jgi:hypothetical protein
MNTQIDFILGFDVLKSYKRLSYKAWYALAEFIDNSTQSYRDNKHLLDEILNKEQKKLTVKITYSNTAGREFIQIEDNSIGMDAGNLQNALTIGKRPTNYQGRSKYGMGLKTAAFWFGDYWEVKTKKYGEEFEYSVKINLRELTQQDDFDMSNQTPKEGVIVKVVGEEQKTVEEVHSKQALSLTKIAKPKEEHYTIIFIKELNQKIHPYTSGKIKKYLRSIYRRDLERQELLHFLQNDALTWSEQDVLSKILKDENNVPWKKDFTIDVKGRRVNGWAALLAKGSRAEAGFSILQSDRVIKGWPESYKPESLFGEQEGGTNDLVNQRLFGEMELDGFAVSHTKDEIIFIDDEEIILNERLGEILANYKRKAAEYKVPSEDEENDDFDYTGLINTIFEKFQNPKFRSVLHQKNVLSPKIIKQSFNEFYDRTIESPIQSSYEAHISNLRVKVIINDQGSVFDPYLVTHITASEKEVGVIINKNHPHWRDLKTSDSIINFIKHCIYDGLAEWKANFHAGSLDPDTVKMMKDGFLRELLLM